MAIDLGYLLPTRERIVAGHHGTQPILSLANQAEDVGLDSVWVGDSLLAKPRHEPLALLAAIAGRTNRIKVGTAVLLPMLRNPVLLAHQAATIDQISEGRLVLGLGTARDIPSIQGEFQAAGVPFEKRIGRMIEQVRLCRALWSGEKVDWHGLWTVKKAELAPEPYTVGGPPLWGGGGTPSALRRAGRYFDGWFPSGAGTPQEWGRKWALIKEHAEQAGRDSSNITGALYATVSAEDDADKANAELDHYLESYYMQPAGLIRQQQYCFAGAVGAVTAWLREFVDAGATHLVTRFAGSEDRRQMERLAGMRKQLSA